MQTVRNQQDGGQTLRQDVTPVAAAAGAGRPPRALSASIAPALLSEDQSAAMFGVSVRKFAELRREPWMPLPIALGPRLLRWSRAELEVAVASMPRRKEPAEEPLQLAKGRAARSGRTEMTV